MAQPPDPYRASPEPAEARLDLIFHALADATRRRILEMLLEDDLAVTDVAEPLPMSLAAVSKHLTVLARAGLISRERRGRVTWCRLEPDALRAAATWLESFGLFEPLDLDRLEAAIDRALAMGDVPDDPSGPPAGPIDSGPREG